MDTCSTGERYNRNSDQCEKKECPPMEPITNGVIFGNSFELGSRRLVRCNPGFIEKTNQTTMLCADGYWNFTPECVPTPCPIVPDLLNGNMSQDGNIVRFTCNNDFVINGVDTLGCVSGVWNGAYPTCERITTTASTTTLTTTISTTTTSNSVTTTMATQPPTTTPLATTAISAPCSPLSAPVNGTMEGNGNVMKFECNHGYIMYGESVLACQRGSWNGTEPLCNEAPCDPLSSPNNGGVSTVGKVATFTCQSSYCMYGSQSRMCSLGKWNGSETSCVLPNDVCANEEYLVTGPNGVPDSSITVSSQYFEPSYPGMQVYGVRQARLNATLVVNANGSYLAGVWASNAANVNQYIQVRFPTLRIVTAVSTRGRKKDGVIDLHGQKVTSYHVYYSTDCSTFYPYKNATNGQIMTFTGNTGDSSDLVTNVLPCPVAALCMRVNPRTWLIHISMQFDVKGCLTSDLL